MSNITIYTSMLCGFCHSAKKLLKKKGLAFDEIDITIKPSARREMIKLSNGSSSVPQIFIGTTHVGGCDELYELEFDGELDTLLAEQGIVVQPAGG